MPPPSHSQSQQQSSSWIDDPIAIVGIGLRLPGSVRTPAQYWDLLTAKRSGRCRIPSNRYNVDAFLGPKGKQGHVCTEYGYFLNDDLAAVDSSFWSMPPKEMEILDPQQRLMMEVVYECLESSGTASYRGKDIGLYIGVLGEDWMDIQTRDPLHPGSQFVTGYGDFAISNRLSKELGLTGPSMTIRTACSSSLMALHTACQALYMGECSSAVVGGCNLILTPRMTATMSELGVLSPNGNCRSFDAHADGYARGEALNAIQIKRLSHALRDGDPIRSVIRSVCINSDGPRAPLHIPSPKSHELLIRRSHQLAGISDLSQTAMIECHGTGTTVGDMQEGRAVAKVFGELGGILIGSVKPNIGHSEGASGLSSIIKMVLALENQRIPPNINFTKPNPKIPFEAARLRVPVECEPWPKGKAERVGLNGFGIGGANGHVLLESARSVVGNTVNGVHHEDCPQLLVFSGSHPESVNRNIESTLNYLAENATQVADASYTLGCHRRTHTNRAFAVGSVGSWDVSPVRKAELSPDLVWAFAGQGAQYAEMGKELIKSHAAATATIRHLDQVLDSIDPGRSWTIHGKTSLPDNSDHRLTVLILEELFRPESSSRLNEPNYAQPCCTAIQIALVDILRSMNVQPAAVVGHSAGEIGAAYAAGALTAAEAITVSYHRGQVASQISGSGGMMAVSLSREQISPSLPDTISIACENSPTNVTLSGDVKDLETVASALRDRYPDVLIKRLPVNCAYHSVQMKEVEHGYLQRLESLDLSDRKLSSVFISSVTGTPIESPTELGPEYWCRNLTSPVLFHSAVRKVVEAISKPLFLEVGSHSTLLGPLRDIAPSTPYIPTLVRGTNSYKSILRTAGQLFQTIDINLSSLCMGKTLGSLPPYQWHHDRQFWSESRVSRNWRFRQHPHHELLGSQIPDGNEMEPLWRSLISLDGAPWLRDHVINGKTVLPSACYIAIAGEAIREISGHKDFSLRRVTLHQEPTLHEHHQIELLTQFRPSEQGQWYDFSITSYFEGNWTKLCTGQARDGRHGTFEVAKSQPGPRKVRKERFYRAMTEAGRDYRGRFRVLANIAAGVSGSEAAAKIVDMREKHEGSYTLHPSTITSIFQLVNVAQNQGRYLDRLVVPTYIEEVYFSPSSASIDAHSMITKTNGRTLATATGFSGDDLVLAMSNIELDVLNTDSQRGPDPHAGARLVWRPDINEVDISSLIRPSGDVSSWLLIVEELALTCAVQASRHFPSDTCSPHYIKYQQWLHLQRQLAEQGEYAHVPSCQAIASMSPLDREQHIINLYKTALDTPARDIATAVMRIFEELPSLFSGQTDSLNLLMKDDLLGAIYAFKLCDFSNFFRVFGHNRPTMRVLEIGAGTGGATAAILPALHGAHGERLYESYTYTDISTAFFEGAEERFASYEGIEYRPLDITENIGPQGFNGSYDLIIASNVLHATPDLQNTLANVKALLRPNGKLFLQELAPATKWINYIMGTLPGWWLSTDNRPWEPYVCPERWDAELRAAGLSGADSVVHDGQMNAHIVSSMLSSSLEASNSITILCEDQAQHLDIVLTELHSCGFTTDIRHIGEDLPANQLVISLLELNKPLLHSLDQSRYLQVRDMITSLGEVSMLWVTKSSQVNCSDPRYAATLGLLRTARREFGLTIATLEIDAVTDDAIHAVTVVAERILRSAMDEGFDPVLEYAYVDKGLMVGRFYPAVVGEELLDTNISSVGCEDRGSKAAVLKMESPGNVDTLHWKNKPVEPPQSVDDWVEIDTCAIGINPNDIPVVGGTFSSAIGSECTGVVQRIGPGVRNLRVGDRVMALSPGSGVFASRFMASEKLCARLARDLSFAEGATMPLAFATALYALIDIARAKCGDTVLIYGSFGGVGMAAVQVCRIIEAEVYCIIVSPVEAEYLAESGLPSNRILHSTDGTLLRDLLKATNGSGVDAVLNTSAIHLDTLWKCVADFGMLVDLVKRDCKKLPPGALGSNRMFAAVDLTRVAESRPELIQRLLKLCMHHYALGELNPLSLVQFPAQEVKGAFQFLETGNTTRAVVTMPEDISCLAVQLTPRKPSFSSDGVHLIVGGLGGLGRSISSWMACHGARHFVFFSPSASKKGDDPFVEELRAQGCRVDLISGDVSDETDVDILIKCLDKHVPIAGIMQASMALEPTSLSNMSFEQWNRSFTPKVQGTWNLHNTLLKYSRATDYFLLFSSLSGLIGQTGHANYAAGNAFLDAFVQYRHSLGLPCSSVNIGVMDDVGYVSEQQNALDHFAATSTHALREQDLLDAVQLAISKSMPASEESKKTNWSPSYVSEGQICIGLRSTTPLHSPDNRISWRRDPRMALYHNMSKANAKHTSANTNPENDHALETFLNQVKLKPEILREQASADVLGEEIGKALFNFMLRDPADLKLDIPLTSLGVDSLLAIKLKKWFERVLEVDVAVVQILGCGGLRELGGIAAKGLIARFGGDTSQK
ncbi:hypothetical protein BDV18DRAFT_163998 [Aspergillus unguis]